MRKLKNENIILLDFHIKNRISEVKEKMILVCKDFKFDNNSLSKQNLISVNFDDDTSLPSALNRDMESSEMNKYRPERIGFGTVYTDVLTFDIHIIKNDFMCKSQEEMEFTNEEWNRITNASELGTKSMTVMFPSGGTDISGANIINCTILSHDSSDGYLKQTALSVGCMMQQMQ